MYLMGKIFLTCLFLLGALNQSFSQALDAVQGEFLIQMKKGAHPQALVDAYTSKRGSAARLKVAKKVKAPMEVWKLRFDHNTVSQSQLLVELSRDPMVNVIQNNHFVKLRQTIPDDPQFSSQWQWFNDGSNGTLDADVDAELAWDIATGGQTPDGDDIVVAVLDDGTELDHEDLIANHWTNEQEIPNNGMDDDGNGYIDDYNGWSIITDNDNVSGGDHGVLVSGMIGAAGNNGIGVTGINWDVKIMSIKNNFNTQEDRVLEAYAYPYIMRKMYNETNGQKGAFVVSTNASWGIDGGDPEDSPLWCQFYDSLGVQGILNCGATSNGSINVDVEGDLPTACPSDYMVAVTRSGINDQTGGGFGPINIDLAAPGIQIFSTAENGDYGSSTGTSFSSPLVAGMIGLLYAAPCANLTALAKTNPAQAALDARALILDNVDVIPGYANLVATSGRANAFLPMQSIMMNCGPCPLPSGATASNIGLNSADLEWINNSNALIANLRYRQAGDLDWIDVADVQSPFALSNLIPCTQYEFEVMNECDSSEFSDFTPTYTFETLGCCDPPEGLTGSDISENGFTLSWNSVLVAMSYDIRYREVGNATWTEINTSNTTIALDNLSGCRSYEVQARTLCQGQTTEYSNSIIVKTLGCGGCTDFDYCAIAGDTEFEYIDAVTINGSTNTSGDNGGYAFYESDPADVYLGSNDLNLVIGYTGSSFTEGVTIYLDVNQDGEFQSEELLVSETGQDNFDLNMEVPLTAKLGLTRIRIIVSFNNSNADPCTDLDGEIEDYCVVVQDPVLECLFEGIIDTTSTTTESIIVNWPAQTGAIEYQLRWKESTLPDWTAVLTSATSTEIIDLDECTDYDFQIATFCANGQSNFTTPVTYKTRCILGTENPDLQGGFVVYPNPFNSNINLSFSHPRSEVVRLSLINTIGQEIAQLPDQSLQAGLNEIHIDGLRTIQSGVYFLRLNIDNSVQYIKIIKH